jgi:hypothetical protein
MKDESSEPKNGLFALTALEWMISSGARSSNPPRLVPREVILEMLEDALRISRKKTTKAYLHSIRSLQEIIRPTRRLQVTCSSERSLHAAVVILYTDKGSGAESDAARPR